MLEINEVASIHKANIGELQVAVMDGHREIIVEPRSAQQRDLVGDASVTEGDGGQLEHLGRRRRVGQGRKPEQLHWGGGGVDVLRLGGSYCDWVGGVGGGHVEGGDGDD